MKRNIFILVLSLLVLIINTGCSSTKDMERTKTVENLELKNFLGKWYEVARFDHSFERGLSGVTATYSMREDGKIKVLNQGYKGGSNGELSQAVGKAKIPNPTEEPGKLKVSFFWIFYGDYFVLELDEQNYQWALIGSSSEKYLWILSRTPQLEDDVKNHILEKIKERGYSKELLIWVEQKDIVKK